MEVALARRAVPEVGHRDDVVLPDLRGPGGADRLGDLGPDRARHCYEVDVLGSVVARHLPAALRVFRVPVRLGDDGLEREAPDEGAARLAVRGEDPVPFLEGHRATDLARFLALARYVEADAALALEGEHPVVEDADHDEVAVRLLQGRGGQLRLPLRIVGAVELDDAEKVLFGRALTPLEPVSGSGLLSPKRIHRPDTKSARADPRQRTRSPSPRRPREVRQTSPAERTLGPSGASCSAAGIVRGSGCRHRLHEDRASWRSLPRGSRRDRA